MKIDYKLLKQICFAEIQDFEHLGEVTETPDGIYIHIKSEGARVLGVAHLDTVLTSKTFKVQKRKKDILVHNEQLDDRLGVYALLHLIPQMGINCDILLTEGEEVGRSTAKYFNNSDYNWIFSFDRRGDDVVLYQYQDAKINSWEISLKNSQFKIGIGSFSDIAFMESLGIKGVNIGTGYIGEHSRECRASMNTLQSQVTKFSDFYNKNCGTKYPHAEVPYVSKYREWDYGFTRYNPYYNSNPLGCYLCEDGVGINPVNDIYLCDECFAEAGICQSCNDVYPETEMMDGMCLDCNYWSHLDLREE